MMTHEAVSGSRVGIVEWIHLNDYEHAERVVQHLKELNIEDLRTGISWADYFTPEGPEWFAWLIPKLAQQARILPCFLYTPPSLGIMPKTSSPPQKPKDYADFLDLFIRKFGSHFEWVELWNEPNNRAEYDYTLDQQWTVFCEMVGGAAYWMKQLKKKTVLGGMSPVDPNWLQMIFDRGVMKYIDVVGIHGFPHIFDHHWNGWGPKIQMVERVIEKNRGTQSVWITEAGFSTWNFEEKKQLEEFFAAKEAPVPRMYWYGLQDLSLEIPTVSGHYVDEREYYFGLMTEDQNPKLLYRLIKENGVNGLEDYRWMTCKKRGAREKRAAKEKILITGGAGFIGTNLAKAFLTMGKRVCIVDNLSRPGVEKNLKWLKNKFQENLEVEVLDLRNFFGLKKLFRNVETVYHFAAQVAVTSSCRFPINDFGVNVKGTLHLLEAVRKLPEPPQIIYTSTNKVYGLLNRVTFNVQESRYEFDRDHHMARRGFDENCSLDFYSPYGCSKGSADQYVHDYARIYGLKTAVVRMSCIYGPHQHGTEDQGWVAHFLLQALKGRPITIYGDGKQVRDILYVEDLVRALLLLRVQVPKVTGQVFNLGGGAENSVSLLELLGHIEMMMGKKQKIYFRDWRPGDQKYYVTDFGKFQKMTGWKPQVGVQEGLTHLLNWLLDYYGMALNYQVRIRSRRKEFIPYENCGFKGPKKIRDA